ncbi:TetR/AcrR family transcriptional regulator [Pedobacter sp. L105]|uniref:TetR/AcrR family transcriptional regulator n=1 Tax=Pedobacter sp. L105 TaxID=1641871 RepID=UPI00131C3C2F|nr:TetR/AcrR family transcriptional regulator [Pedobacter sp. L105]
MKNKGKTKRKLLDAVGEIIKKEGFSCLGVNKIAKLSGVSKILIYRYFGSFDQLIRTYIMEKDFWMNYSTEDLDKECNLFSMRDTLNKLLSEQFVLFYNHCEMQAILLGELSNHNELAKTISDDRMQNRYLHADKKKNPAVYTTYVDVISTLLVAGTDHLIFGGQKVNALDIEDDDSGRKEELLQSIEQIVDWTFQ